MVNNQKKESRMEGVDMRFVQTEQNVERLGIEFDSMKDEMASMKLLLQEIASGMRDKPNRKRFKNLVANLKKLIRRTRVRRVRR